MGVRDAPLRGVGTGHGRPDDMLLAERFDGENGRQGRVNATAESEHGPMEAAFAEIVPEPQNKCVIQFLKILPMVCPEGHRRFPDDGQLLGEACQLPRTGAVGRQGQRVAVKDKLIIATDRIAIIDRGFKSLNL